MCLGNFPEFPVNKQFYLYSRELVIELSITDSVVLSHKMTKWTLTSDTTYKMC